MKKRMSRILSILLVSVLVMSTGSVALAEDVQEPAVETQGEEIPEVSEVEEPEAGEPEVEVKEETPVAEVEEKEEVEKEAVLTEETAENDENEAAPAEETAEEEAKIEPQNAAEAKELDALSAMGAAKELKAQANVMGSIPLNRITSGTEAELKNINTGYVEYANTSAFKKSNMRYGYAQAVSLTKGTLLMSVVAHPDSTDTIWFGLYRDAALTQAVDSYSSVTANGSKDKVFKVPGDGTYYMGVYSDISSSKPEGTRAAGVVVGAAFCDGRDRTVANKKQVAVGVKDNQTTFFKFVVKKAGYIKVPYIDSSAGSYRVALFNSKKKALSKETQLRYSPLYGVKPGTYYIRVKSYYNSEGAYAFKVQYATVAAKSATTQKKALTLKRGKKVKGIIQAGAKQTSWYKFKKTNKKAIKITCKCWTNEKLRVTVYRGKKKVMIYGDAPYYKAGVVFTGRNWPKGTYYIKVENRTKTASGYYEMAWK